MINKSMNVELKFFRTNLDFFINLYLAKKLPQTLLFTGDKNIGKLDLTYHLVNFILVFINIKIINFCFICILMKPLFYFTIFTI